MELRSTTYPLFIEVTCCNAPYETTMFFTRQFLRVSNFDYVKPPIGVAKKFSIAKFT